MILIVDDDPSITASLALLLKQHGHRSSSAHSVDEALGAIRSERPSLVIQDMNFSRRTTGEEGLALLTRDPRRAAGRAGDSDDGVGLDRAGGRRDEARRGGFHHQAVVERECACSRSRRR